MPRYFAPISENEFKDKLTKSVSKYLLTVDETFEERLEQWPDNPRKWEFVIAAAFISGYNDKIMDDLSKINFSFENCEYESNDPNSSIESLMRVRTLDNGMTYLGLYAGGDWEFPVFFIVYWDGKQFRGYVPEKGNTFNEKYRCAYGSEEETWYQKHKNFDDFPEEDQWDGECEFEWDVEALKEDIMDRIKLKS